MITIRESLLGRGVLLGIVAASLIAVPARSAILQVDAAGGTPYTTIQSAINAAIAGQDEVFVNCGIYRENLSMRSGVTVRGASPDCAIVDGRQLGSVVSFQSIAAGTVLEGFTLRNGRADFGGGVFMRNSAAEVRGNVVADNATTAFGSGGGIYTEGSAGNASPKIVGNVVRNNIADESGGGIGVYDDRQTLISNNLVADNSARQIGGGIAILFGRSRLFNNTVVRNCIQGATAACDGGGGGIGISDSTSVELSNNLVAWNQNPFSAGGVEVVNSSVTFRSNDAWSNTPVDYAGITDPTGANGNIKLDPALADEHRNFRGYQPRSTSPLLEAALVSAAPVNDLWRIPRPQDGLADGTPVADIGARENEGLTRLGFAADKQTLTWDTSRASVDFYHLYRGVLAQLRSTGVYTQNPTTVPGAAKWCDILNASQFDGGLPSSGQVYFYLAAAAQTVHGSLGFNGTPTQRPIGSAACN